MELAVDYLLGALRLVELEVFAWLKHQLRIELVVIFFRIELFQVVKVLQLFADNQELKIDVGMLYLDRICVLAPFELLLFVSFLDLGDYLRLDIVDRLELVHNHELLLMLRECFEAFILYLYLDVAVALLWLSKFILLVDKIQLEEGI